jgi:hypothetical protein
METFIQMLPTSLERQSIVNVQNIKLTKNTDS